MSDTTEYSKSRIMRTMEDRQPAQTAYTPAFLKGWNWQHKPAYIKTLQDSDEAAKFIAGDYRRTLPDQRPGNLGIRVDFQSSGLNKSDSTAWAKRGMGPIAARQLEKGNLILSAEQIADMKRQHVLRAMAENRFFTNLDGPKGAQELKFYLDIAKGNGTQIYAVQSPSEKTAAELWGLQDKKAFGGRVFSNNPREQHNLGMEDMRKADPFKEKLYGTKLGERLSSNPRSEMFVPRSVGYGTDTSGPGGTSIRKYVGAVAPDGTTEVQVPRHMVDQNGRVQPYSGRALVAKGFAGTMGALGVAGIAADGVARGNEKVEALDNAQRGTIFDPRMGDGYSPWWSFTRDIAQRTAAMGEAAVNSFSLGLWDTVKEEFRGKEQQPPKNIKEAIDRANSMA